jgi:hypothetical protein
MKIAQLSPVATKWQSGQVLKAGSGGAWSVVDDIDTLGSERRTIRHYDTVMGEFVRLSDGEWTMFPFSVGLGSKSDQDGMNTLLQSVDAGLRFFRNGVPRYSLSRTGRPVALSFDRNRTMGDFVADHNGMWSRAK